MCQGFGPVIDWRIDGFDKGTKAAAIIAITDSAEYLCVRACQKQRKEFQELQVCPCFSMALCKITKHSDIPWHAVIQRHLVVMKVEYLEILGGSLTLASQRP